MSDRLAELRRQRSLVIEQLTWLDREIQREADLAPPADATTATAADQTAAMLALAVGAPIAPPTSSATTPTPAAPATATTAADILVDYEVNPVSVRQDVKKGCLIYFAAAFGVIGALLVLAYFTLGKR